MDEKMTDVVNVLADRVGVAADKLAPIANTLVEETANRGLLYALLCFIAIVLVAAAVRWVCNQPDADKAETDGPSAGAVAILLGGLVMGILVICGCSWLGDYIAPTCALLDSIVK